LLIADDNISKYFPGTARVLVINAKKCKIAVDEYGKTYYYESVREEMPECEFSNKIRRQDPTHTLLYKVLYTQLGIGSAGPKIKEETRHEQFSCKRESSWHVPGNV
jgi:hypothetical protein